LPVPLPVLPEPEPLLAVPHQQPALPSPAPKPPGKNSQVTVKNQSTIEFVHRLFVSLQGRKVAVSAERIRNQPLDFE
jgi:hypothetical protein